MVGETGRGLAAELVPAVALRDPRRAEDRDAVLDVAQSVEALVDLGADALGSRLVFPLDIAGDAEQMLVPLRSVALARSGQSAPKYTDPGVLKP